MSTLYECPVCYRVAPWTDGLSTAVGDARDEFWCQTCGAASLLARCEVVVMSGDEARHNRKDPQ